MTPPTSYSPPSPSALPKRAVQSLAESVANQLGYKPGGDLRPVLDQLGGKLTYQQFAGLHETDSGSLVVHDMSNFEVRIATNTSIKRDNFTIAHEIGHYILHYLYPNQNGEPSSGGMVANRYGSDRVEWEANWFAAAFLMPEEAFRLAFSDKAGELSQVADLFGVSTTAAEVRAKALGLIAS